MKVVREMQKQKCDVAVMVAGQSCDRPSHAFSETCFVMTAKDHNKNILKKLLKKL